MALSVRQAGQANLAAVRRGLRAGGSGEENVMREVSGDRKLIGGTSNWRRSNDRG